jgi:hypothetical protein
MKNNMPEINLESLNLTSEEMEIAKLIIARGKLRATKPVVEKIVEGRYRVTKNRYQGYAYYVWRMVAFQVSPIASHWCMPVLADFDMVEPYAERRAKCKELDKLCDKITNSIPKEKWYGILRWGRAMGQIA